MALVGCPIPNVIEGSSTTFGSVSWGTGLFPCLYSSNLGLATLSLFLEVPPPAPGPDLVGPDLVAIAPSSDRDILRSRSALLPLLLNGSTSVRRIFYNHIALRKFPIIVRWKAIPHHPNAHVIVASIALLGVLSFAKRQSPIRFFSNPQLTLVCNQYFLSARLAIGHLL
jgi:hypothetical protein